MGKEEIRDNYEVVNLNNLCNEPQVTSSNFIESDYRDLAHCKQQESLLEPIKKLFRKNKEK